VDARVDEMVRQVVNADVVVVMKQDVRVVAPTDRSEGSRKRHHVGLVPEIPVGLAVAAGVLIGARPHDRLVGALHLSVLGLEQRLVLATMKRCPKRHCLGPAHSPLRPNARCREGADCRARPRCPCCARAPSRSPSRPGP
jgi:hypothetical protein